jgi:hypothetical protein
MLTALVLVALVMLAKTTLSPIARSSIGRRFLFGAGGALQLALGIAASAGITFQARGAWAASDSVAAPTTEEVFFEQQSSVSVEPAKTVIIPPGRPAWIAAAKELPPHASWTAVVAGPCETRLECEQELSHEVKRVVDEHINQYLGSKMAARLLDYDGAELKNRLVSRDTYGETIQVSFGPMEQLHARVLFTDDFHSELRERWRKVQTASRLGQVGLVSAVVLGLLATAFGFFKANVATRGTRSTNLQFASAATILMIVVAGVMAARYLYWL